MLSTHGTSSLTHWSNRHRWMQRGPVTGVNSAVFQSYIYIYIRERPMTSWLAPMTAPGIANTSNYLFGLRSAADQLSSSFRLPNRRDRENRSIDQPTACNIMVAVKIHAGEQLRTAWCVASPRLTISVIIILIIVDRYPITLCPTLTLPRPGGALCSFIYRPVIEKWLYQLLLLNATNVVRVTTDGYRGQPIPIRIFSRRRRVRFGASSATRHSRRRVHRCWLYRRCIRAPLWSSVVVYRVDRRMRSWVPTDFAAEEINDFGSWSNPACLFRPPRTPTPARRPTKCERLIELWAYSWFNLSNLKCKCRRRHLWGFLAGGRKDSERLSTPATCDLCAYIQFRAGTRQSMSLTNHRKESRRINGTPVRSVFRAPDSERIVKRLMSFSAILHGKPSNRFCSLGPVHPLISLKADSSNRGVEALPAANSVS